MKKFAIFLILFSIFTMSFSHFSINFSQAAHEKTYWAKIENDQTFFYAQDNINSQLFVLPKSYFVKLTGEEENFYKAQYKDLSGYVKKEEVTPMDGQPLTPFFVESFRVFLPSGTGLYAMTQMADEYKILDIPYLYEDLVFYGSINGTFAIPEKTNLWHYCRYEDQLGFVYSIFCDKLLSPPLNNESFDVIENPSFEIESPIDGLSSTAMAFIIIGVSLPCLIVLYLLIKPNMMKSTLPKEKVKYKAKRKRDYFEFDQSDLG